jgi:hypothetical protein
MMRLASYWKEVLNSPRVCDELLEEADCELVERAARLDEVVAGETFQKSVEELPL